MSAPELPLSYDLGAFVGSLDVGRRQAIARGQEWLTAVEAQLVELVASGPVSEREANARALVWAQGLRRGLAAIEGLCDVRGLL